MGLLGQAYLSNALLGFWSQGWNLAIRRIDDEPRAAVPALERIEDQMGRRAQAAGEFVFAWMAFNNFIVNGEPRSRAQRFARVQVDEIWSFTAAKQKNVAAKSVPAIRRAGRFMTRLL